LAKGTSASRRSAGGVRGGVAAYNPVPLYHQIFLIMKAKIVEGEYGPGAYLPGERELCDAYNVSRITAVRALNDLAAEGLVVRERGRGTRVQIVGSGSVIRGPVEAAFPNLAGDPDGAPANLGQAAKAVKVYKFAEAPAIAAVAEALRVPTGTPLQEAVRVTRFGVQPHNHLTSFVPIDIGRTWTRRDLEKGPMAALFERAGIKIARTEELVTATLADVTFAERLEVPVGSPLIKITRLSFASDGRPVNYFIGHYPPDRYQYRVTLPR